MLLCRVFLFGSLQVIFNVNWVKLSAGVIFQSVSAVWTNCKEQNLWFYLSSEAFRRFHHQFWGNEVVELALPVFNGYTDSNF